MNLPARCVVIRDTKLHDPLEGEVDMSPLDVLQMLGRAGRPGYDDMATPGSSVTARTPTSTAACSGTERRSSHGSRRNSTPT